MKNKKSITKRLFMIAIIFTMSVTTVTATYYYFSFRSILYNSLFQSTDYSLQLLNSTIQYDINNVLSFLEFCVTNDTISSYLKASDKNQDNATILANHAWNRLREEYRSNSSYIYFNRVLISDLNDNYIQLSTYDSIQNIQCATTIQEQDFFENLYQKEKAVFSGFELDPIMSSSLHNLILPLIRPISTVYGEKVYGWCYLALSPNIFINHLKNYNLPSDSKLYLTIGDHTYLFNNNSLEEVMPDSFSIQSLKGFGFHVPSYVTTQTQNSDWFITQTISMNAFYKQTTIYLSVILLLAGIVILLGFIIALYLRHSVNIPIRKLQKKISLVSQEDFSRDPEIEWNNELGDIGIGINTMCNDISQLIQSRMEDQQNQFKLEYEVLQNQINPHFLYNTLNSISLMATAQGSRGISEMATSLSCLLKSVSKKTAKEHTIREELDLLSHYFLIQKYRYGGILNMNYHIECEDLYNCFILQFILQIIVENAIFHGIGPKKTPGIIDINITSFHEKQDVLISIQDNGIGMSEELINQILNQKTDSSDEMFHKIGLQNIQKRMHYAYGANYGITIESILGQYTKVKILVPYRTKEETTNV